MLLNLWWLYMAVRNGLKMTKEVVVTDLNIDQQTSIQWLGIQGGAIAFNKVPLRQLLDPFQSG